jgi:hypothetical protein
MKIKLATLCTFQYKSGDDYPVLAIAAILASIKRRCVGLFLHAEGNILQRLL